MKGFDMTKFNQFTFWNANDTREHVTLQLCSDGTILHLSRDAKRSVRKEWRAIGTHRVENGLRLIRFTSKVPHLWVAGTQLAQTCDVRGSQLRYGATLLSRKTDDVTDPDTLLGRKRRRSLDLGIRAKCDPPTDWAIRAAERAMARK
jgi:hypothetical protein